MSISVQELQNRIAALVDQDADSPTEGGDEWDLRMKYLNLAQQEWAETYQWPSLFKEVNTTTSQSTGNVTVSLPSDFRKFDGSLRINWGGADHTYPQILPEKKKQYIDSEDYFYVLGNPSGGYNMVVNPGSHGSGASIFYSYWSSPASLASAEDISSCPDPNFLIQRSAAYYWQARDDGRFVDARAEADKILARMLEFETTKGHSYDDRVQTYEESRYGFRIGRD